MDDSADKLLTGVELELMEILWRIERGTVRDVLARLPADRPLAYTSVSTVLRILEQKGFVTASADGRAHVYAPTITRVSYEATSVKHLVGQLFDGRPAGLVRRLVDSASLTDADVAELRALLDRPRRR
ncbi:MAG TPA: BlaI/MecI/CopY family transcriptional regulator [Byssovorax sp.]